MAGRAFAVRRGQPTFAERRGREGRRRMAGKTLGELLEGLEPLDVSGLADTLIEGISNDSRRIRPGFLFVCIQGFKDDGHRYVPEALERGVAARVGEGFLSRPAHD